MKKLQRLSALVLFLSALSFVSCDTEPADPVLLDNVNNPENPGTNPDNPDNPAINGYYWPFAINNQWKFIDNEGIQGFPVKIFATEDVSGLTYFKSNYSFFNVAIDTNAPIETLFRYDEGNYYVRIKPLLNPINDQGEGVIVPPYEFIILKDYLEAGQTWTEDITHTTTNFYAWGESIDYVENIHYESVVQEKDITMQVNGITYENVIKVKQIQTTTGSSEDSSVTYIWFAKDVGPIKYHIQWEGYDYINDLISYTVN